MGYANKSGASSGYAPYARPKGSYRQPAPDEDQDSDRKAAFTELSVVAHGFGDFHLNHFLSLSEPVDDSPSVAQKKSAALTRVLSENFPYLFSKTNVAEASWGKASDWGKDFYEHRKTVKFELGGDVGANSDKLLGVAHSDWVAMQDHRASVSFYATTLKREWRIGPEKLLNTSDPLQYAALIISQRHVLAGRRSWKVGFDAALRRYYVETATLERNSSPPAALLDVKTSIPRELVVQVWSHMIDNFTFFGRPQQIEWAQPVHFSADVMPRFPDYEEKGDVLYRVESTPDLAKALSLEWFKPVFARHPGLTEGVI